MIPLFEVSKGQAIASMAGVGSIERFAVGMRLPCAVFSACIYLYQIDSFLRK